MSVDDKLKAIGLLFLLLIQKYLFTSFEYLQVFINDPYLAVSAQKLNLVGK